MSTTRGNEPDLGVAVFRSFFVVAALLAWASSGREWAASIRGGFERLTQETGLREEASESILVHDLVPALRAAAGDQDRILLLVPRDPGPADDLAYTVYRLAYRLHPRKLDVGYMEPSGSWRLKSFDYRRSGRPPPVLIQAYDLAVTLGGFTDLPPGFERITPPRVFGFGLYRRHG